MLLEVMNSAIKGLEKVQMTAAKLIITVKHPSYSDRKTGYGCTKMSHMISGPI